MTNSVDTLLDLANAKLNPPYDYEGALQLLEQAYSMAEASGDRLGKARILDMRGYALWCLGDFRLSLQCLKEALLLAQGVAYLEAFSLRKLGNTLQELGEYESALEAYQQALERHKSAGGGATDEALILNKLALCLGRMGQIEQALKTHDRALKLAAKEIKTYLLSIRSLILVMGGRAEAEEAWAAVQEAATTLPQVQELTSLYFYYFACYKVLKAQGRREEAREHLRKAYEIVYGEASRIRDERWRESFLRAAWPNREIVGEWEKIKR